MGRIKLNNSFLIILLKVKYFEPSVEIIAKIFASLQKATFVFASLTLNLKNFSLIKKKKDLLAKTPFRIKIGNHNFHKLKSLLLINF